MTENTDTTAGPTYAPAPPPAPRPPLRRSRTDRVIGGVAGGLGQWLGIDPVIVRVVLVVLAIFGGSGLLLYAAGWLFIPDEGEAGSQAERFIAKGQRPGSTTRTVLIVIAAIILAIAALNLLASGPTSVWNIGGGSSLLLLLAVGGVVIYLVKRSPQQGAAVPPATSATAASPSLDSAAGGVPTLVDAAPAPEIATTGFAYGGSGEYPGYSAPVPTPVAPRAPRERSYLGLATLSLSLVTMGVLSALAMSGALSIPLVVILSAGLGVLGLGLLVGTLFGRAKWLMAIAIPLLLVVAAVAVVPTTLKLPKTITVGDRVWTPTTVQTLAPSYSWTVGEAVLDLTNLALPATGTFPIKASVGIGELRVKVPAGMHVSVTARTGLGEIRIAGQPNRNGQNVTVTTDLPGTATSTGPSVDLTAQVGVGTLAVSRA